MISIRKQEDILVYGAFEEINTVDDVIGYKRTYQEQEILCFCNFTNKEQPIPKTRGNILLDNYNDYNNATLKPYQFVMIKKIEPCITTRCLQNIFIYFLCNFILVDWIPIANENRILYLLLFI